MAYDLMSLGEMYMASFDLRKARQLIEQAIQEISPTRDARGQIYILNDLGEVLLAMSDAMGGSLRFTEARDLALNHKYAALVCEATAGLAASAVMQGHLDEAHNYIREAWDYLKEHGWYAIGDPARIYHSCAETFDALGEEDNLQEVLEIGYSQFIEVANKINIPDRRQSFLENNPHCRAFMEMWERRKR
jgi:tetratricopeptide (TPR) repeat protein